MQRSSPKFLSRTLQPSSARLVAEKRQEEALFKDPMLKHLNPGCEDKEFAEFVGKYRLSKEVQLESFGYNKQANEENFMVKIAGAICDRCAKAELLYKEYFMKFNPTYREFLKL